MPNEILISCKKNELTIQKNRLLTYMRTAQNVTKDSTYVKVREAQNALYKAQGMYEALDGLKLLDKIDLIGEDLDRINVKVNDILEEKRRKDMPKWRN